MVNYIFTDCHTHLFSFQNKGSETVCITYCKASSGFFPDDLKLKSFPIFNAGKHSDPKNYRPISVHANLRELFTINPLYILMIIRFNQIINLALDPNNQLSLISLRPLTIGL